MIYITLLFLCLYLPFQLALNPSFGIDLASVRIIIPILFLLWILTNLKNKKLFIPAKIQTILVLSFVFFGSFSLFFAQDQDWGLRKLLFIFSFIPLYFIAADLVSSKKKFYEIIEFLACGAGIISIIGIIQFIIQFFIGLNGALKAWQIVVTPFLGNSFAQSVFENPSWLVGISGKNYFRAIALFPDPHMFSFYLGMALPWTVALSFLSGIRAKKILFFAFSACIFAADLLTFSRGGYLGLLAGAAFTLILFGKKIKASFSPRKIIAINVFVFLVAAVILTPHPVSRRLYSSFDIYEGSNIGRFKTWKESLKIISANPLGVGLGNYALAVKPSADYREPIYSHNLYLDIAAETGIVNALIFIWLIAASALNYIKKGRKNGFYLLGAVSLVIFSVHSIFETPLFSVQNFPFFLVLIALSTTKDE